MAQPADLHSNTPVASDSIARTAPPTATTTIRKGNSSPSPCRFFTVKIIQIIILRISPAM